MSSCISDTKFFWFTQTFRSIFSPKIIAISKIFDEYERLHPFVSQVLYNLRVRVVSHIVNSTLKHEQYWKENCLLLKLYRKLRKMFLSSRRESNPQPSDFRWDALTIELPGLRWQREGHDMYRFVRATYVLLIQQSRCVCLSY